MLAGFDALDPFGHLFARAASERKDRRRARALLGQPQVEHLFDGPGRFAEHAQADHAARPLERMEGAPQGGQVLLIRGAGHRFFARGVDGLEHFARFAEEDREQFGIDDRIVGRRERQRGGIGRRRFLDRLFLPQFAERGREGRESGIVERTGQHRQRIARRADEFAVVEQFGALAQFGEFITQLGARGFVMRRGAHGVEGRQRAVRALLGLAFDAGHIEAVEADRLAHVEFDLGHQQRNIVVRWWRRQARFLGEIGDLRAGVLVDRQVERREAVGIDLGLGRLRRRGHGAREGAAEFGHRRGGVLFGRAIARHARDERAFVRIEFEHRTRSAIGLAQGIDEEAERAEGLRDALELALIGGVAGLLEAQDRGAPEFERCIGGLVVEQQQSARGLVDQRDGRREAVALVLIAEEGVERLFDRAQVGLDFGDQGRHRRALVRAARNLGQPFDRFVDRLSGLGTAQPIGDQARTLGELRIETVEAFERVLDEQHRSGGFHADRGSRQRTRLCDAVADLGQGARDFVERGFAELRGDFGKQLGLTLEARGFGGLAAHEAIPGRFQAAQLILGALDELGVDPAIARGFVIARHRVLEREGFAHPARHRRRRTADGHIEQRILEQTLGQCAGAFDGAAHLKIHARAQALEIEVGADRARHRQGFEQAVHHGPERTAGAARLGRAHGAHGERHVVHAGIAVHIAQELQQAALEAHARRRQAFGFDGFGLRIVGHAHIGVDEQQIGRVDAVGMHGLEQIAVMRVQADRLVGAAGQQIVEVIEQAAEGMFDQRHHRRVAGVRVGIETFEQAFSLLGDQ